MVNEVGNKGGESPVVAAVLQNTCVLWSAEETNYLEQVAYGHRAVAEPMHELRLVQPLGVVEAVAEESDGHRLVHGTATH